MKIPGKSQFGKRLESWTSIRVVAMVFSLLSVLSTATAQTTLESQRRGAETTRVVTLERLWNQAEVDKDVRALEQIVPDTFIYVDIVGKLSSKEQFLSDIKNGPESPVDIRNESMVTQVYANTVVVTGIYREKGTSEGKPYTRRGRFTDTWVKVDSSWQCVASQSTLIGK
jgi:Domain of unknown function (DUF4440)